MFAMHSDPQRSGESRASSVVVSTAIVSTASGSLYTATFWRANMPPARRKIPFCSKKRVYDFSHLYFVRFEAHHHLSVSGTVDETNMDLTPPFEGLEIKGLLGRGAFGHVFEGVYTVVPKDGNDAAPSKPATVAVKVMCSGPDGARPLEGMITLYGDHPNVLKVRDCKVVKSKQDATTYHCWIIMDMCGKGALLRWVDKGYFRTQVSFFDGRCDLTPVLDAAVQIARGIHSLHSHDIIHGDLNCNNVLVTDDFTYKLADFGLSRVYLGRESQEHSGMCGTVTHMPPEMVRNQLITLSCDVYAFGVILYELYTSRRAWAGTRYETIVAAKFAGEDLQLPDHAPAPYAALFKACIHPDHKERPTSAQVLDSVSELQRMHDAGLLTHSGGGPGIDGPVYP